MSRARTAISMISAAVFALLLAGCGGSSTNAPRFDTAKGQHPADWLQNHWAEFAKSPARCTTCHGSTTDPQTAGGISKVSCFTCHAKGPGHPVGWAAGLQHGRLGAQAAPGEKTGFAYCFKCHGNNISAGLTATSCLACHTTSPHPSKPWSGSDPAKSVHYATDAGNVPECFKCHKDGANSTIKPATPAPAGTAPGCFNNTMCHSKSI
ncbi:MAG: hypothetical protein KGN80_06070 [Acidobacteriota bacterium]|nr:hypothetical protein [Acidobacteriota bacterium]